MSRNLWFVPLLLATGFALAEDVPETQVRDDAPEAEQQAAEAPKQQGAKEISGMSVLGNREAPKSLVIVPWKSSEIGDSVGIATVLDDSKQPVDREVFLRALSYYEIRSESTP